MAEDHRAAWLAETSQLRTYKRQRDTVIGTTAATEKWKRDRLAELDEHINDALWLIDLHLDHWNANTRSEPDAGAQHHPA